MAVTSNKPPLEVLVLSDGKMGDLSQCRGVANALADSENILEFVVKPNWITALPLPHMPISAVDRQLEIFAKKFDCVIASGRRTLPYLKALKSIQKPAPLCVFLKNPRWIGRGIPDLMWAPLHDNMALSSDVICTDTAPHNFNQSVLSAARTAATIRFKDYHSPITGIFLGGNSGPVIWDVENSATFAKRLTQLPKSGGVLVTSSRRTPKVLINAVKGALKEHIVWSEDGSSANPYVEILARADRFIVTGDSHNMVSEVLASGKPVYVYRPPKLAKKFHAFLDSLERKGAIKNLDERLQSFVGIKMDATQEIADFIRAKLTA